MIPPETHYTKIDDAWIAYQVIGDGPIDLVFNAGISSNIEVVWDVPLWAAMLERMATYSRLILFDRRGSGISEPLQRESVSTWELWSEDLRAVLDAAGSERTAIFAQYDGAMTALLFAATNPERTTALILWNGMAGARAAEDYPEGRNNEEFETSLEAVSNIWGTVDMAALVDPTLAADERYLRLLARHARCSVTPGQYVTLLRYITELDARHVLPSIRVPTLVLHREKNNFIPMDWGRYIAEHIEGARFVAIPGVDLSPWATDTEVIHDQIEAFLGVASKAVDADRILATVLFSDIVGSTETAASMGDRRWKEMLGEHDRVAELQIGRFNGRIVNRMGDGFLATFDGPGRAIRCVHALSRQLGSSGIKIRAGLHTGEIELRDDGDVGGIAVHIAARVMGEAGPGEVVCSRTVKDLVAGSEFAFEDRGLRALKGVPDEWQLYAVRQA